MTASTTSSWLFPSVHLSLTSSLTRCNKIQVWQHMMQMKGVNEELMPWIYMTYPDSINGFSSVHEVPLGKLLFRSTLLLFGLIPIDLHFLQFHSIQDNEGFEEDSTSLLQYYWRHKRTLREHHCGDSKPGTDDGGSYLDGSTSEEAMNFTVEVRDDLLFQPRIPLVGYLLKPIVRLIFSHRHEQLKRKFCR